MGGKSGSPKENMGEGGTSKDSALLTKGRSEETEESGLEAAGGKGGTRSTVSAK